MRAGFQVFDPPHTLLDTTTKSFVYRGSFNTGVSNGSYTIPMFIGDIVVFHGVQAYSIGAYIPIIRVSGRVVSWTFPSSPGAPATVYFGSS